MSVPTRVTACALDRSPALHTLSSVAPRDLAFLIGLTLIWGLNLVWSKIGVSQIPPVLFTALRFLILGLILIPWLRIRPGQMSALVVACLLSGALQYSLYLSGLSKVVSVSSAAIASQLSVPFTTLLSVALLGEVVRWRRWTGVLLSFGGVFIMGFDPHSGDAWRGLGLIVLSALVGALGLIAIKKLQGSRPLELQAWLAWISVPVLTLLSLVVERPDLDTLMKVSPLAWGSLAFSAIGASLIAHTGYFYLVQRYPVTSVAPVTTLSPVFSVVIGVAWLGERLNAQVVLGGMCTLVGVLIITLREKRIVDTGS